MRLAIVFLGKTSLPAVLFMLMSGLVYGKQTRKVPKPVSLDSGNLTRLRDSTMAYGIQEGFCTALKAPKACPECVENFMGANQYRKVLENQFLLVDSEENGFGGVFMLVIFNGQPEVYRLWVYRLSSGAFQLREMAPYIILNQALMNELTHSDYAPYWLDACPRENRK